MSCNYWEHPTRKSPALDCNIVREWKGEGESASGDIIDYVLININLLVSCCCNFFGPRHFQGGTVLLRIVCTYFCGIILSRRYPGLELGGIFYVSFCKKFFSHAVHLVTVMWLGFFSIGFDIIWYLCLLFSLLAIQKHFKVSLRND